MNGIERESLKRKGVPFTWRRWQRNGLLIMALLMLIGVLALKHPAPPTAHALDPVGTMTTNALLQPSEPFPIQAIGMVSPTDGWIGGQAPIHMSTLPLRHYRDGKWIPVPGPTAIDGEINSIAMISATDGWAVGDDKDGGVMLHYTDGQWTRVPIPQVDVIDSMKMVSATEGWAGGDVEQNGGGTVGIILHYVHGQWRHAYTVSPPQPGGESSVDDITIVSASEGWALDEFDSLLLHYVHGQWRPAQGPSDDALSELAMVSTTEGWGVSLFGGIYHYGNGTWTRVRVTGYYTGILTHIVMESATEGWATGFTPNFGTGIILHYFNGQWHVYHDSFSPLF